MLSFFPSLLRFVLQDDRDAGAFRFLAPVPGLELAAAAHCPDPVSSPGLVLTRGIVSLLLPTGPFDLP